MNKWMFFIGWVLLGACFLLGGCRVSITAKELSTSIQIDEPGYLGIEDVTFYSDETSEPIKELDDRKE